MIPRTVLMAQEVAAQFTPTEIDDYGNIILNGYLSVVPNTVNKKAWQYKETLTAPVNLPSLTLRTPAMKGWTNNYQEYYTQLQPNGYGVNPGDPTMFEYTVHSFVPSQAAVTGIISTTGSLVAGSGYLPGTYNIALTGGAGTGAYGRAVVDGTGVVTSFTLIAPGSGYAVGNVLTGDIPGGSGWSITVSAVTNTPAVAGGQPRWSQVPHRFFQNQVADFAPPNANQQAIQYSFVYPIADSLVPPPTDVL
jgi:hypothetical protein